MSSFNLGTTDEDALDSQRHGYLWLNDGDEWIKHSTISYNCSLTNLEIPSILRYIPRTIYHLKYKDTENRWYSENT